MVLDFHLLAGLLDDLHDGREDGVVGSGEEVVGVVDVQAAGEGV